MSTSKANGRVSSRKGINEKKVHDIQGVRFTSGKMILQVGGKEHVFRTEEISAKLASASDTEKARYEISPSGYGIHWPLIDEDLSIDGLLGIHHTLSTAKDTASP